MERRRRVYQAFNAGTGSSWIGGFAQEVNYGMLVRPANWLTSSNAFGDSALLAIVLNPSERAELLVSAILTPPARSSYGVFQMTYSAVAANADLSLANPNLLALYPNINPVQLIPEYMHVVNTSTVTIYLHAFGAPKDATGIPVYAGSTRGPIPTGYNLTSWAFTGASNPVPAGQVTVIVSARARTMPQVVSANLYLVPPQVISAGGQIPFLTTDQFILIPMRANAISNPQSLWNGNNVVSGTFTEQELGVKFGLDRPLMVPVGHGLAFAYDVYDEVQQNAGPNISTVRVTVAGVAIDQQRA